jgi:hypothetical protein
MPPIGQFAVEQFALDLEADEQKEHRHQAIVDPVQHRFAERQCSEADFQVCRERLGVRGGERGVRDHHGKDCGDH